MHACLCALWVYGQGLQWRLEVFKTRFKGWGVRSWDTIPVGSYITTFVGRVHRVEDCDDSQDDTFYFDLGKRTDYNWDNQLIENGRDECAHIPCSSYAEQPLDIIAIQNC